MARVGAWLLGIHIDEQPGVSFLNRLNEAVFVAFRVGEDAGEILAVIVITKKQLWCELALEFAFLQHRPQSAITPGQTIVGKVTGDDDFVGICVVLLDIGQHLRKIIYRCCVKNIFMVNMNVGDMYEFHKVRFQI